MRSLTHEQYSKAPEEIQWLYGMGKMKIPVGISRYQEIKELYPYYFEEEELEEKKEEVLLTSKHKKYQSNRIPPKKKRKK